MNKVLTAVNDTMTRYRWTICTLLFFATTINYLDRQVLSLLQPQLAEIFHWSDSNYGTITGIFSLAYAISMIFVGRFIDRVGTKTGYAWAIGIWSFGACIHALCGIVTKKWVGVETTDGLAHVTDPTLMTTIASVSVVCFIISRVVLAIGEAGNFPAAIKATAEYFPKKDRAFATGIFNSGSNVGAILAPLSVPFIAEAWGWEYAFLLIGAVGFIWLIFWHFMYKKPEENPWMNDAERAYANQDAVLEKGIVSPECDEKDISFWQMLKYKQTWGLFLGKLLTDGVWWFFLFWTPVYLKAEYNMSGSDIALPIAILYTITVFGSVFGGKFPNLFISKGMHPYDGRMKAMMFIAFVPLVVLLAQPLGHISYWIPVVLIGIGGAGHQAWSANFFTTGSDLFPKKTVATITGITGLAGGLGSFIINQGSGTLITYCEANLGGKSIAYTIIFSYCAVAYILGWLCMKVFTPKFRPIKNL